MSITPIFGTTYPTETPGTLTTAKAQLMSSGMLEVLITIAATIDGEINAWVLGYDTDCGWQPLEMLTCNKRDSPKLAGHNGFKNIVVPTDRYVLLYFPEARAADVTAACVNGYAATASVGLPVGGVLTGFLPDPGLAASGVTAGSKPATGKIPTLSVAADGRVTALGDTADGTGITSLPIGTLSGSALTLGAGVSINGPGSGNGGLNFLNQTGPTILPSGDFSWIGSANKGATISGTGVGITASAELDITAGVIEMVTTISNIIMDAPGSLIELGRAADCGVVIAHDPAATIGMYGHAGVAQHSITGTTTGFTAGVGTGMKSDSTSTGGNGTKAYTFGDIVLALKNLGAIAAS